jgi:hypothetical protein
VGQAFQPKHVVDRHNDARQCADIRALAALEDSRLPICAIRSRTPIHLQAIIPEVGDPELLDAGLSIE